MLPPDDRAESKKFDGGINMKKLLALLLAALMVFGMAVTLPLPSDTRSYKLRP